MSASSYGEKTSAARPPIASRRRASQRGVHAENPPRDPKQSCRYWPVTPVLKRPRHNVPDLRRKAAIFRRRNLLELRTKLGR